MRQAIDPRPRIWRYITRWHWLVLLAAAAHGQTCQGGSDMDASMQTGLEATARRYFAMSAKGDTAGLRENSIPSVAAGFGGIEAAVRENQAAFSGAQATVGRSFLLTAEGTEPLARAEFLCGVFGTRGQTKDSAVFVLTNLPPGKYGIAILDVSGPKPMTLTLVLQQAGTEWKLAGLYAKALQSAGHDSQWFIDHAREFKAKKQNRNAWFYYHEALSLAAPVSFMSTMATDRLYDEAEPLRPSDLPANGNTVELAAAGKTFRLTDIFPLAVSNDIDLVVKYEAADVSNNARAFQDNAAVIHALVAKFPEFRDAFAGVVARAVEPSGHDYGTLLAMKDIK